MSQRFATRTAWASFCFAFAAAVLTAITTGGLGWWLLRQAEDARLSDAALVFAAELKSQDLTDAALEEMVNEEVAETNHMGTAFAAFDPSGQRLAGDRRLRALPPGECAAIAVAAFAASRPLAASVVAPLSRLELQVAQLDASTFPHAVLASDSRVTEVESLRRGIESLLHRVDSALTQATRFAADAAHELRTPLSTIEAELELMIAGDLSAPSLARVRNRRRLHRSRRCGAGRDAHFQRALEWPQVRPQGTVRVTSRMLQFDDDGPGVPVAERTRVFEALYRGVNARSSRVPGHGLGLALIAHIACAHGGTAAFEDAPGARLTVKFAWRGARVPLAFNTKRSAVVQVEHVEPMT